MERSAGLMSFFVPGHEMQEAQNKLQAFRLFAYVDEELRIPQTHAETLQALTARALALSDFRKIWALEGVAHYYMNSLPSLRNLRELLSNPAIPETAMVPMHAGMGTSFAGQILSELKGNFSRPALRDALQRFFELCRANARDNWLENAIEPMGLAVRSLHPHLLATVGDAIGDIDIHAQRLYWHGVGRSLYFVPTNFITFGGSHERALRTAIDEAPTMEDRRNAVAGLVWAITLVNLPHPEVLRNLLRAADRIRMPDAVINGIVSALMIWKHMVPDDQSHLPVYLHAAGGGSRDARLWNEYVATPASTAFASTYPALLAQQRIASLFEYKEIHR
jgi:hypothetical protein